MKQPNPLDALNAFNALPNRPGNTPEEQYANWGGYNKGYSFRVKQDFLDALASLIQNYARGQTHFRQDNIKLDTLKTIDLMVERGKKEGFL